MQNAKSAKYYLPSLPFQGFFISLRMKAIRLAASTGRKVFSFRTRNKQQEEKRNNGRKRTSRNTCPAGGSGLGAYPLPKNSRKTPEKLPRNSRKTPEKLPKTPEKKTKTPEKLPSRGKTLRKTPENSTAMEILLHRLFYCRTFASSQPAKVTKREKRKVTNQLKK